MSFKGFFALSANSTGATTTVLNIANVNTDGYLAKDNTFPGIVTRCNLVLGCFKLKQMNLPMFI